MVKHTMTTMYNPAQWLEIATSDLERAKEFYENVYNLKFEYVGMPDSKMYMFGEPEGIGTGGCLFYSEESRPSKGGALPYFSSEDLSNELQRVEKAIGQVIVQKTDIGEFGFFAHIIDSEGNKIGLPSNK